MEVSGHLRALAASFPGERVPGTHCTGSWVGHRTGLDSVVKRKISFPCREWNPIFREITVRTGEVKTRSIDFIETDITGQADFIVAWHSVIKNGLHSNNRFLFQSNLDKSVISVPSHLS
jgi:hypothetical protein